MTRAARLIVTLVAGVGFTACAALPDDAPVVEKLDPETGITIMRLGSPVELYRETFQLDPTGRFAFLAPFETNLMGKRELYLWVAVPDEPTDNTLPAISVNGTPLALSETGRDPQFAGVGKSPYKIPTPWSSMFYFKIDAAAVARLGEATELTIHVLEETKKGKMNTLFASPVEVDPRLRAFALRQQE